MVNARISASVIDLRDEISQQSRLLLWCLVGAAVGLLLIACTNLANLLLTRGLSRKRELAVRAALGAGSRRLLRQILTESVLLAAAGGAVGIAIAAAAMPTLVRLVPTGLPIADIPPLNVRLLASAATATFLSAIGFGLIPALRVARHANASGLRDDARTGVGQPTERLRSALVVVQVCVSVVLLVSCGLLLQAVLSVQRITRVFGPTTCSR